MLIRRVPYRALRKAIRRICAEHLKDATHGRVTCLDKDTSRGPLRLRVRYPSMPTLEPELRLNKGELAVHLDDLPLSELAQVPTALVTALDGICLTIGGSLITTGATLAKGKVRIDPVRLPYENLRPLLYAAAKLFLPKLVRQYVTADITYFDEEKRLEFEVSKLTMARFEASVTFGEKDIVVRLEPQRLAAVIMPVLASQVDAQLEEWADEWEKK